MRHELINNGVFKMLKKELQEVIVGKRIKVRAFPTCLQSLFFFFKAKFQEMQRRSSVENVDNSDELKKTNKNCFKVLCEKKFENKK